MNTKRILIAFTLAATLAMPAAYANNRSDEQFCETMGMLAALVMLNRQAGKTPTQALAAVRAISPTLVPLGREFVKLAYDQPRYHSPEMQKRAEDDMRSLVEAACLYD